MLENVNMFFYIWAVCLIFPLFFLFITVNLINAILATLVIFGANICCLFYLGFELIPLLILLVVVGALLVLIIFSVFILNQIDTVETKNYGLGSFIFILILIFKLVNFISSWKFYSFSQIWLYNQVFEKENLMFLYQADSHGLMLIAVGMLLLIVTLGVSEIFKKN